MNDYYPLRLQPPANLHLSIRTIEDAEALYAFIRGFTFHDATNFQYMKGIYLNRPEATRDQDQIFGRFGREIADVIRDARILLTLLEQQNGP